MSTHTDQPPLRAYRGVMVMRGMMVLALVFAAGVAEAQPAPTSTGGGGFFVRSDYLAGVGSTRGSLHRGRFDMGMRFFNRTQHLKIDIGVGIGGGVQRRLLDPRDRVVDFGVSLDVRGYLNPGQRVQIYGLGGLAFGVLGGSEHDPEELALDEECPSDSMIFADVSGGVGAELRLSDNAGLSATFRVLRRTHLAGDLVFTEGGENPPGGVTDHLLGVSIGLDLTAYFDVAPAR